MKDVRQTEAFKMRDTCQTEALKGCKSLAVEVHNLATKLSAAASRTRITEDMCAASRMAFTQIIKTFGVSDPLIYSHHVDEAIIHLLLVQVSLNLIHDLNYLSNKDVGQYEMAIAISKDTINRVDLLAKSVIDAANE